MAVEINLSKILSEYSQEVTEAVKKAQDEVADEAIDELKQTSPKSKGKNKGGYAKGWAKKRDGNKLSVYNKYKPQLTHLLENGHSTRDGGRTTSFPHIKPAEQNAIKSFQSKVEEAINNAK